jgi:hypothetical protein
MAPSLLPMASSSSHSPPLHVLFPPSPFLKFGPRRPSFCVHAARRAYAAPAAASSIPFGVLWVFDGMVVWSFVLCAAPSATPSNPGKNPLFFLCLFLASTCTRRRLSRG